MRHLVAVCLLFSLVACGSEDDPAPSTPTASPTPTPTPTPTRALSEAERVVDRLMRALEAGDCKTVKDVVVTPSAIDCGQVGEAAGMLEAEGVTLDEVKYKQGSVNDDSSTVTISWAPDLPPEPIELQRVDGEWLVVFDSAA